MRERSARWQQLLQDGFSDIASDIDFDLRERSRTVLHEAEATISEGDPAKNWEEFEAWLRQRLAAEALENYAMFVRRAKEVAATVSEHFALAEADVIRVHEVAAPVELIGEFAVDSKFVGKKAKGAGLATFQKAYSGMLMFTMLTHLAGLAILPMFLPVVGLAPAMLMGRAGLMDDRRRRLEQRRAEAKATVRRFVDDFNMQVGKDSRDAVRHVQRELRSACADRVTELQRSASEALAAAQASVTSTESAGTQRERIDSDLVSLALLRARMDDLAAHRQRRTPKNPLGAGSGRGPRAATAARVRHDPAPGSLAGPFAVARRRAGAGAPRRSGVRRQPGDARAARRRPAAGRAAAGGDRRPDQGREVDPAQRAGRPGTRRDRRR